jgi:hypothetical protein
VEAPVAGTTYVIDPDFPSSRFVPVQASGVAGVVWESDSLEFRERDGRTYVEVSEGTHRLSVRDPATGARAETWIYVKTL